MFCNIKLDFDDKDTFESTSDLLLKWNSEILPFQFSFSCDQCPKMFTWLNDCKRHMSSHAGAHSGSCDVCDKLFKCESELKGHIRAESSWVYLKYCDQDDLKDVEIRGRSFIAKMIENFIFQVF